MLQVGSVIGARLGYQASRGLASRLYATSQCVRTVSGNRGLTINEKLIFEQSQEGISGVDLPNVPEFPPSIPKGTLREGDVGLPGLSEAQAMRHYVRLSQKNFSIDTGIYPLGSCTMKYNPRANESFARLPGFSDVHPLQPVSTVQGVLEVFYECGQWLKTLTGMPEVSVTPAAGSHGELIGLMAIRQATRAENRTTILVPEAAHGTNPASAIMCGFKTKVVPGNKDGRIDVDAFLDAIDDTVAGTMITNPNTCGLFEKDIVKMADAIHKAGGYLYMDGANLNAMMGHVRPGDLGVDAMHINLHKTMSTPHGGGGPGAGPVVFSEKLSHFAPLPRIVKKDDGTFNLVETRTECECPSVGRIKAFHGQTGMLIRSLAYMMALGGDGLTQTTADAVLNANYLMSRLSKVIPPAFGAERCMHECLFDDAGLKDTGVETLDLAKAMLDEGYHPMTMYFPLVVHGAMLYEPTESETKKSLDQFADVMTKLIERAREGDVDYFKNAPYHTPVRRVNEAQANRKPILRYK